MSQLLDALYEILKTEELTERIAAEHRFAELLTFSDSKEIIEMLDQALAQYWIDVPVWARNLSFRLVCLLEPNNAEIRRRAAADLRCFGPDWDAIADGLDREAEAIEQRSGK